MKNVKALLNVGFVVLILFSCSKEDRLTKPYENRIVTFTSSIADEHPTRASDTSWDVDDKIGIFMKSPEILLGDATIVDNAANKCYVTTDQTIFLPATDVDKIEYPSDGSSVDFIAYYPYKATLSSYIYNIDVSDQSSLEAIELLYSNNLTSRSNASHADKMIFRHQLAKLVVTVKAGKGISDLSGIEVGIEGVSTTADFDLSNLKITVHTPSDQTVAFNVSGTSATEKIAQAILIPEGGTTERILYFKLASGKVFKHKLTAMGLESGKRYTFNATLNDESAVVDPTGGYIETPLMANLPATQQYVIHMIPDDKKNRNFAMLYDTQYRVAYWVAYPLVPTFHTGGSGRTNAWAYDPKIEEDFQPDLSSGFPANSTDRGHQIPSGDRTCSAEANRQTFYYSNMTAQQSQMNQGIWASLEGKVRTWASNCDTMYVVTGAMIQTPSDQQIEYVYCNSSRKIARPKYYFKALAQRDGNSYTTIAFLINNEAPATGDSYNNHRLTVKELESQTGYTFFPLIPESDKEHIENNKWN